MYILHESMVYKNLADIGLLLDEDGVGQRYNDRRTLD